MALTVAIVGRPNVGKSTLFNRLAGKKLALVHDTPGVTRDRREVDVSGSGFNMRLIDTAGFEEGAKDSLAGRMTAQTLAAIAECDVAVFAIDGREGITASDEVIGEALRKSGKPVILVANKCESSAGTATVAEAYSLGFGEALRLSAEHALGFEALDEALASFAPQTQEPIDEETEAETERVLRLAIVGRPNVGKSSLFNLLLGEERALTGPEAGLTRDSIAVPWTAEGREILLHDTAGLRKRARAAGEVLEQLSISSTLDAVRFADCVIVVIDATQPFEKQDLTIADLIAREGRAVVFAINKWDIVENRAGAVSRMREQLDKSLPQVAGAPLIGVSATTGEGVERLMPAVMDADRAWNTRVPTAQLNRFLEAALARHAPPAIHGRRVRIRYMTQVKARPPTFALFGNQLNALPEAYTRYLMNGLREAFNLQGAPVRLLMRTSKNPYAE